MIGREAPRERRAGERAADRRRTHPGDHQPARRIVCFQVRRLDAPERVAQMVGQP